MKVKERYLTRSILKGILWSGLFVVACSSPKFVPKVLPQISRLIFPKKKKIAKSGKHERQTYDAFNYLRKKGLIRAIRKNKQVYIFLTGKGKKLAGKYQINDLEIKKPKKWDKLWRILVFDIREEQRAKREALRGKIRQLGLYQLQKSVWVYPYNFFSEIKLLREFFGLKNDEMKIITAYEIENDKDIKKYFGIR
ncbi:MAG: hypothetical protein A3J76_05130 [Candidatus Moranbacteria bacterium RBG_13_45_13]|nr:MAG: hypothetical protein A3J76_05130 [Candidatus Moranbacteria bacterium RBG_13_45_13]